MAVALLLLATLTLGLPGAHGNRTQAWIDQRSAFINDIFGLGSGVLPNRSQPDAFYKDVDPGVDALVWDLTHPKFFKISSTVFYSPIKEGARSANAFLFHHGHTNCICPTKPDDPPLAAQKCRPGCNSSMPTGPELKDPGYTWWDLYNVSNFFHSIGYDVFILSMPLKGINLGPGSNETTLNSDWEDKGDHAMRYFIEPIVLTINYAKSVGYKDIFMAGLSGGGWSTTFGSALDTRIKGSFPIAGSIPCAMRNPNNKSWPWGNDAEDFEQNCSPNPNPTMPSHPGRLAFQACNYTCQYLLAGLEPERFQVPCGSAGG